jgi:hypothetical protein
MCGLNFSLAGAVFSCRCSASGYTALLERVLLHLEEFFVLVDD